MVATSSSLPDCLPDDTSHEIVTDLAFYTYQQKQRSSHGKVAESPTIIGVTKRANILSNRDDEW